MSSIWGIGTLGVVVHDIFPWLIWGDTRSVEGRVSLRRPEMIVSEAGVDIVDSSLAFSIDSGFDMVDSFVALSIGFLLDLVTGKDSIVSGMIDWYISG